MPSLHGSVAGIALVVLLLAGCGDKAPTSAAPSAAQAQKDLKGSPPSLQAVHRQAGTLVGGGKSAFEKRLTALKGHPVVVNKWASWCGPCRFEFPAFQKVSVEFGKTVGFLGVNSSDDRGSAQAFLKQYPVSYPSYEDPHSQIANSVAPSNAFPLTAFYDRTGKISYVHQGGYSDTKSLARDVRRYAIDPSGA